MLVIFVGYLSGLIHKFWWQEQIDGVIWLYAINALLIFADILLYLSNQRIDRINYEDT